MNDGIIGSITDLPLFVLAGGKGTRLKEVVSDVPKCLAPIGAYPFLQIQIESWISQGLKNFTFLLYDQASHVIDFLEKNRFVLFDGCNVNWVVEPAQLDTGGAVANAIYEMSFDGDFLLTNADTWIGSWVKQMLQADSPALAIVNSQNSKRYGSISFDENCNITQFLEKNDSIESGWISAGLSRLNSNIFKNWDGAPFSMERDIYPKLIQKGNFKAVTLRCEFVDIGVPEDYHTFMRSRV